MKNELKFHSHFRWGLRRRWRRRRRCQQQPGKRRENEVIRLCVSRECNKFINAQSCLAVFDMYICVCVCSAVHRNADPPLFRVKTENRKQTTEHYTTIFNDKFLMCGFAKTLNIPSLIKMNISLHFIYELICSFVRIAIRVSCRVYHCRETYKKALISRLDAMPFGVLMQK